MDEGAGDKRDMHKKLLVRIAFKLRLVIESLGPGLLYDGSSGLGSCFCCLGLLTSAERGLV